MASDKDKEYIENLLSTEIECKNSRGELVLIPYRKFILRSISEIDSMYLRLMYDDYKKNASSNETPLLVLNKFQEFFGVKPILFLDEEMRITSMDAINLRYRFFFAAYNYLKELNNSKKEGKKIYYSKFKTSGLFYSNGETKIEIFEDDTLVLTTPEGQKVVYQIETLFEDRNDRVIVIRNTQGGLVGEFRMQPLGKAEIKFPGRNVLKLKI